MDTNELTRAAGVDPAAVQDFETPDVEAPQNATAVTFGRKAAGVKTLPPSRISISVLNGNGVTGSASTAAYELGQRGYRIVIAGERSPTATRRTTTTSTRWSTSTNGRRTRSSQRGRWPTSSATPSLQRLPALGCARKAQGALVTVVVGSTFHGTLAPAPARQDAEEAACVRRASILRRPLVAEERAQEGRRSG